MFAKSGKGRANARKRSKDEDEDGADDNTSAVVRNKKQVTSALFASTSSGSKKKEDHSYESARTVVPTIGQDNNALAPALEEDEKDGPVVVGGEDTNASGAKLYKGQAGYQKLIAKGEVMDKKATSIGPIKAPTNVRLTCRFDYQPDLCKDYKETGYCTFGDSCKFMHDRGDYKAGWELDRDWEKQQEKKKLEAALREMEGDEEKDVDEMDDGLPFACAICRGPFKNPVETRCMHYFCEGCAMGHYTKNKRCALCNEQTFGQFNTAVKLITKLNRMKARKESEKEGEPKFAYSAATGGGDSTTGFQAEGGWAIPGNTFQVGKQV
mmetsp:Transcript_33545/g.52198  ORF Transcript_33545/g.52198 Transcript_33545/m.52198 type:complete len:324 (-) Transcript_33545:148-1119(-)